MSSNGVAGLVLWPFANVYSAIKKSDDEKPVYDDKAYPTLDLIGHITAMFASLRSFGLAYVGVYLLPQITCSEYPAFGDARTLRLDWMLPMLLRNITTAWIICGLWDWFLYFSPFQEKLHKYKINHKYPSMSQFKHDAFYTTLSSVWSGFIEMGLCYGWASGKFPMQTRLSDAPLLNIVLAFTITHLRLPHFYLMHRSIHPWKTKWIPDVGKCLYKHIHSIHHKSYNPTAFSGTSMHPFESTMYYSAGLIPVAFGLHPVISLAVIIDSAVGAWLGHDGFRWPGNGDYFHYLHHKHFDGNYGAPHVPLDWLFGSFISCKEDVRKVWKNVPAGEEVDETVLHEESLVKNKVE